MKKFKWANKKKDATDVSFNHLGEAEQAAAALARCIEPNVLKHHAELQSLILNGTKSGKRIVGLLTAITYDDGAIYVHDSGQHNYYILDSVVGGNLAALAGKHVDDQLREKFKQAADGVDQGLRRELEEGVR